MGRKQTINVKKGKKKRGGRERKLLKNHENKNDMMKEYGKWNKKKSKWNK